MAASAQHDMSKMPESGKKSQGKMDKMNMSTMKQEPHHLLAMAYKENLVNFAKTLRHEAAQTKPINSEFARAVVAEMKRSFDQMQEHHQSHMKTMNDEKKTQMADMMKQMDTHQAAVGESLAALDKEVQTATPDPKSVVKYVDGILEHCGAMSKMHGGAMDHKMDHKKTEHKMN
ncbi:MAG: hypothetical protein ABIP81_08800 [Terriglobales bacterium]